MASTETRHREHLTFGETCLSGIIMGFFAYTLSFSVVPIIYTTTALIFGMSSKITIFSTAFGQLLAGYLHTHSSRMGMAVSTKLFHGFYIAKPNMKNRRKFDESICGSLKRFFCSSFANALVLNFMWETFTFFYILHTELMMKYLQYYPLNENSLTCFLLINGFTRLFAGCLSGMSTGLINQLWQRYQARRDTPQAIFNTDKKKLKLKWKEGKKLLSPCNLENWIKVGVMVIGALFVCLSGIPNKTIFYSFDLHTKKLINDILVIHGGWLFLRDSAMLVLKKKEKSPVTPSNTTQSPLIDSTNAKNGCDPLHTSTNGV